jgi:hypothetical protein
MKMKKVTLIAVLLMAIAACKPEIKPIGDAYKAGAGMPGTWELTTINSIDITLPVPEERDQSMLLADVANRLVITMKESGEYTVDQRGIAPNIFGTDGTWMFDRIEFPTMIYLVPTSGDTLKADLLNMPRIIDNQMGFAFTRNRCTKNNVTLQYTFNRK